MSPTVFSEDTAISAFRDWSAVRTIRLTSLIASLQFDDDRVILQVGPEVLSRHRNGPEPVEEIGKRHALRAVHLARMLPAVSAVGERIVVAARRLVHLSPRPAGLAHRVEHDGLAEGYLSGDAGRRGRAEREMRRARRLEEYGAARARRAGHALRVGRELHLAHRERARIEKDAPCRL